MIKAVQINALNFILHYRKGVDVWTREGGAYTTEESLSTKNDYNIVYERADKEESFYPEVNHDLKSILRITFLQH